MNQSAKPKSDDMSMGGPSSNYCYRCYHKECRRGDLRYFSVGVQTDRNRFDLANLFHPDLNDSKIIKSSINQIMEFKKMVEADQMFNDFGTLSPIFESDEETESVKSERKKDDRSLLGDEKVISMEMNVSEAVELKQKRKSETYDDGQQKRSKLQNTTAADSADSMVESFEKLNTEYLM